MEKNNLLYIFIGDIKSNSSIGDFPSKDSDIYKVNQLFDKISIAKPATNNQRNKISITHGTLYYIISSSNIFYSVLANQNSEDKSYSLISELIHEDISKYLNERGKLSFEGINLLKNVYNKYQDNIILNVQNEISEVKSEVHKNINNIITNLDDVRNIDTKSSKIKDGSLLFREGANEYRRSVWWQTIRFKAFIVVMIVLVVVYIILR